ncbi:hypothetical protein [Cellulomonas sp. Leaf395]|uniref:hypothetical protein n=1 Tax=Cellulomonas sp. Leaf395 TaxID=1736362 RepID=UPI0012FB4057|nr:hypothetical protein [Cellulomonas sp. Leaf395]
MPDVEEAEGDTVRRRPPCIGELAGAEGRLDLQKTRLDAADPACIDVLAARLVDDVGHPGTRALIASFGNQLSKQRRELVEARLHSAYRRLGTGLSGVTRVVVREVHHDGRSRVAARPTPSPFLECREQGRLAGTQLADHVRDRRTVAAVGFDRDALEQVVTSDELSIRHLCHQSFPGGQPC